MHEVRDKFGTFHDSFGEDGGGGALSAAKKQKVGNQKVPNIKSARQIWLKEVSALKTDIAKEIDATKTFLIPIQKKANKKTNIKQNII